MKITAKALDSMGTANSPEEAYTIFTRAISTGLGQLMADALAKALGETSTLAANPAIAGWENYVKGLGMQMQWSTDGVRLPPTMVLTHASAPIGVGAKPSIMGGSISIGGTWTF